MKRSGLQSAIFTFVPEHARTKGNEFANWQSLFPSQVAKLGIELVL